MRVVGGCQPQFFMSLLLNYHLVQKIPGLSVIFLSVGEIVHKLLYI